MQQFLINAASIVAIICFLSPSLLLAATPVDRVIVISVDGLRGDLLQSLLANDVSGDYANFQRLVDEGTSTFNARTDYTHTVTVPNHTCMITGRPVMQPAGLPNTVHHGYTANSDPIATDTLHNSGNPALSYVASVFDVAHDHGLTTALFASKSKFVIFDQSYDVTTGAPDIVGPNDGTDKIDVFQTASTGWPAHAAPMQAAFMAQLGTAPPQFSFVHYRDLDSAGHAWGWGSAAWNNVARTVDDYLGEVLDFVAANPVAMGRTVVIVTSDHGGVGTGHSDATLPGTYTIPFFVWGSYVAGGTDLYALNSGRLDPGTGRPDYNATAPIRNGDAGNLALGLLGLPAIPGSIINAGQDLDVTSPVTGVPRDAAVALRAVRVYPNPFNGRVVLAYELARAVTVKLGIYDTAGRLVRELTADGGSAGRHRATWDGRDDSGNSVASGVYFFRVDAAGAHRTTKLSYVQ